METCRLAAANRIRTSPRQEVRGRARTSRPQDSRVKPRRAGLRNGPARVRSRNHPDLSTSRPTRASSAALSRTTKSPASRTGGRSTGVEQSIEALGTLLSRPNASPELRAAAFNALAETPGVELNREASDLIGRSGYAVSYAPGDGKCRTEFIFDPRTSSARSANARFSYIPPVNRNGRVTGWDSQSPRRCLPAVKGGRFHPRTAVGGEGRWFVDGSWACTAT